MNKIKKSYYYLFYKFYKFGEWSPSSFPSDWTAVFAILSIEIWFLVSLKVYYFDFFNRNDDFEILSFQTIIPFVSLILLNSLTFFHNAKWKEYVQEFDYWPRSKNIIGTWIVIGILVFVLVNVIVSFHLMGNITGIH